MGGSTGSAGNITPHLLVLPSSDSIGIGGGLFPPAPPAAGATPSPRFNSRRTPPRPSPSNTVASRKSYDPRSSPISQSDTTHVATNGASSRAQYGTSDYNRAVKAAANALRGTEDATLSDGDESDSGISDLTALSAAYNSGAPSEEGSSEKAKASAQKKPKSIFRRTLKYNKPPFGLGRNNGGVNSSCKSKERTTPLPPQKIKADINALLDPSTVSNDHHQLQLSSPRTPKTEMTEEISLDYSTDEDDSKVAVSRRTKSKKKKKTTDNEWNRVEVHTPPPRTNNIVQPVLSKDCMSTPSQTTRQTRASSNSPSTSLSSYSGDTFSTLTTKSSTNASIKTAPSKVCIEKGTKSDEQANRHRRVKSQEEMDDLFATILSITDVPGQGIEDMLKANKTVQSQAKRSRRTKQVSNINAIANINFVEHEERARARESGGLLVPRFESYDRAEEKIGQSDQNTPTQQLPISPRNWRHRRLPSREEQMLAAPRMPIFPRDDQQGFRKRSIDSIEIGRQSPHVQFREERLCSFDSIGGGNVKDDGRKETEILGNDGKHPTGKHRVCGYEHEEELLESEIYSTPLSMEAFHVKVEELNDLSDGLDNDRWRAASRHLQNY